MKYSSALAVSIALFADISAAQGYTNQSEVPLYGQSPPVYPTREFYYIFRHLPAC
jgi:beta-glucosidase